MESPSENLIPSDRRASRRALGVGASAIGLCVFVALLATSPGLPMGWDEGNAIGRAEQIANWGKSWFQQGPPDWKHPLSRQAISDHWPYTNQVEGHPAFYGIVIAVGHALGGQILPPLTAWRVGPILLFALAAAAMFYRLSRDYSPAAGLAAALALLLQPRLFAHAHFATCDAPLTASWILAWAAFTTHTNPKRERGETLITAERDGYDTRLRFGLVSILFGIFLGMTMSTKATGWIAPVPFVLWAALYRDRRTVLTLAIGLPIALATFYVLNPPLWHEPVRGLITFFQLNTNRQLNVANFFLGRMYDLHHPLPWYNTLVWTAIAVPIGLLVLALVGLASILRRGLSDRAGILLMFNWLILLIVRALPGTPPHDGIRLFLPAFAFLAAIIGVGVHAIVAITLRRDERPNSRAGSSLALFWCHWRLASADTKVKATIKGDVTSKCATACLPSSASRLVLPTIALIFLGSATSLFCYAPQWLSYYNLTIGGLPGATRAGMEPTYYWDSLDGEVLDWLAANTNENEKVFFGSGAVENLDLMHTWGTLPVEHRPDAPGRYRWYVIQRRPSACMPPDQWLLRNAEPVYKKYLHSCGYGPWRINVPLLAVYRYEDYAAAIEAVKQEE
jgi:dolichyl-phosphate-mannose-protein mannosyltransferase